MCHHLQLLASQSKVSAEQHLLPQLGTNDSLYLLYGLCSLRLVTF